MEEINKMKMNKVGILVLLMALTMVIGPVSAATYSVSPSTGNANIQKLISSSSVKSGDTISFQPGTYAGINLNITKGLNLVANGAVTLNGASTGPIFNVTSNGVTINGFNLNSSAYGCGINLVNVNNIAITSNKILNMLHAINAAGDQGLNINNNAFTGNNNSINFTQVSNSAISSNNLTNTTTSGNDAVDFTNVNSTNVTNNNFTNTLVKTNGLYMINVYGLNIKNNYFSMYTDGTGSSSSRGTCIAGYSLFNTVISYNNLVKGSEGMNLYQQYQNLTITNNNVTNMAGHFGDSISLVNCGSAETTTTTNVSNNYIHNTTFGLFLGGEFNGTVSYNNISNTTIGMNITGKEAADQGSLNANIFNNTITNSGSPDLAMETPNIVYLNLTGNIFGVTTSGSNGYAILTNSYFNKTGSYYVTNNNFNNATNLISQNFINSAALWSNNT